MESHTTYSSPSSTTKQSLYVSILRNAANINQGEARSFLFQRDSELSITFGNANYENIALGLPRSLLEITEAVEACVKECSLYPTQTMQYSVADLYAHIFLFLRDTLVWYTQRSIRRVVSSPQEDFYEHFEDRVSNIKSTSLGIGRKAQHASQTELRFVRLQAEDLSKEREKGVENTRRLGRELLRRLEVLQKIMSASFKSICIEKASKVLAVERSGRFGTSLC